jgi:hypothetical protein
MGLLPESIPAMILSRSVKRDILTPMRTTLLLTVLCCFLACALVLDVLILRPVTTHAQGPTTIRISEVSSSGGGNGVIGGTVVGFSCLVDRSGKPQCYIATRQ